jgi:hypothetical protein
MKIKGVPIRLTSYEAASARTNKHFQGDNMPEFEHVYLPESMKPFTDLPPLGEKEFVVDDNRSVVAPRPTLAIDGTDFYLSVKGIGSTTGPFSRGLLRKAEICSLLKNPMITSRIMNARNTTPRYLTGELWSRGSPYGVQGLQYANIAMRATEMGDVTSIHGFRIAPLVKIVALPQNLQNEIKKIYWYRKFRQEIVQETRLLPSNVRIYFHSDYTIGEDTCAIFDLFGIDNNDKAIDFEVNFLRSGMAILTLLARSIKNNENGTYSGLDFYDVWLDKDAVLAPSGVIYWADLEGLEWITLWGKDIEEKMEYQIYRSMYELMYAYEQIEIERMRRFGDIIDRKSQFEYLLRAALKGDEVIKLERDGTSLNIIIDTILKEQNLTKTFTILDWE